MEFAVSKRRSARNLAEKKRSIYQEIDSDEDDAQLLEDAYVEPAPRATRSQPVAERSRRNVVRTRPTYQEPDSDEEPSLPIAAAFAQVVHGINRNSRPQQRSRRSTNRLRRNYHEPSTDDDDAQDSEEAYSESNDHTPPQPRSLRTRTAQSGSRHRGPELVSDEDELQYDQAQFEESAPPAMRTDEPSRSSRRVGNKRRRINYEPELDRDSGFSEDSRTEQSPQVQKTSITSHVPQKRSSKARKVTKKADSRKLVLSNRGKSAKVHARSKATSSLPAKKVATNKEIPTDGVRPQWATLPVEILRDIFVFASHANDDQADTDVKYLIQGARACRAFTTPMLEAYYQSPTLRTVTQPHHLLELLRLPVEGNIIDYRVKVKRIDINVKHLAYTAHGRQPFDLSALVQELPQLQHLEIMHPMDTPPFRTIKYQKWTYPNDLFDTLNAIGRRLRTWRWSRVMVPPSMTSQLYSEMTRIHTSPSFEYLQRLVVCGFDYNDSAERPASEDIDQSRGPTLTSAISVLPRLKDLTFVSCDIIMDDFLLRLPKTLERLELSNCLEITPAMILAYLNAGGSNLRELVLNHNPALSLSFLTGLKAACPKLEVLKMDLTYYSERWNYNDAWAFYDGLLETDQQPTWPATLRHLELANLQKWGADASSNLFQSLVTAAPNLPDLRFLSIQAHIDIPWRDRAAYRDNWVDKLRTIFLHKSAPPNPHLGSLKQFRFHKQTIADNEFVDVTAAGTDDEETAFRSASHVRVTPRKRSVGHIVYSSDDSATDRPRQPRRSVRVRVAESQSAASLSAASGPEDEVENKHSDLHIQGLCEIVDIRIDNQRPRETQYTEANFLDSEVSGDEDWHSGAELEKDGYVR